MLLVGPTGSGKSTLAVALAGAWERSLSYDPKVDAVAASLPGAVVRTGADRARAALPGRVVYRPSPAEHRYLARAWDGLVACVIDQGGACGLVVHELADVAPSSGAGPAFGAAYRQGRSRRIPIIACVQRPAWIDRLAFSESEHIVCFGLRSARDRRLLADVMDVDPDELRPAAGFAPYYRDPEGRAYRLPSLRGLAISA